MSILDDNKELEQLICNSVEGLTPTQVREVRLLARDLIGRTVQECREAAQKAVNTIGAVGTTTKL